jgi:hypothetical protein
MRNVVQGFPPTDRRTVRDLVITLACTLAAVMTVGAFQLAAQQAGPNRSGFIPVTVTDPQHRFVNGLQEENFVVVENGVSRPITYFSDADSRITLAIISESPLPLRDMLKPEDELIQTASVPDALRQLFASKHQRKAIIVTTGADVHGVPAGIQVVQANPADAVNMVVELRNQYLLGFRSSDSASHLEVILKPPRGLPFLKADWRAAF